MSKLWIPGIGSVGTEDWPHDPAETVYVASGGNLQTALNNITSPGLIELEPGATFTGPFIFPHNKHIKLRTRNWWKPRNYRIQNSDRAQVAKLKSTFVPFITNRVLTIYGSSGGGKDYSLEGLEFQMDGTYEVGHQLAFIVCGGVLENGETATTLVNQVPRLSINQVWIQPESGMEVQAAIWGHTRKCILRNFQFVDIAAGNGIESKGLGSVTSAGLFLMENGFIEAGSQGVLLGGTASALYKRNPCFVQRHCHIRKSLKWYQTWDGETYQPGPVYVPPVSTGNYRTWSCKNIEEFKFGETILLEGNLFENSWGLDHSYNGQAGCGLVFFNADPPAGGGPTFAKIIVRYNKANNIGGNFIGFGRARDEFSTNPLLDRKLTSGHKIHDNLFIFGDPYGNSMGEGSNVRPIVIQDVRNLAITHNTLVGTRPNSFIVMLDEIDYRNCDGLNYSYNIALSGTVASDIIFWHSGGPINKALLDQSCNNNYTCVGNAFPCAEVPSEPARLPSGNYYFTDNADLLAELEEDYRVKAGSDLEGIDAGKDCGADIDLVDSYLTGVEAGLPTRM